MSAYYEDIGGVRYTEDEWNRIHEKDEYLQIDALRLIISFIVISPFAGIIFIIIKLVGG